VVEAFGVSPVGCAQAVPPCAKNIKKASKRKALR